MLAFSFGSEFGTENVSCSEIEDERCFDNLFCLDGNADIFIEPARGKLCRRLAVKKLLMHSIKRLPDRFFWHKYNLAERD